MSTFVMQNSCNGQTIFQGKDVIRTEDLGDLTILYKNGKILGQYNKVTGYTWDTAKSCFTRGNILMLLNK